MRKLAKYTKPYLLMLIVSIALLFAQANLDLALPDYLSRIVNTGIQQGGVENAVPVAIRQSEMERVLIFIDAEEKDLSSPITHLWTGTPLIMKNTSRNILLCQMSQSIS